jgi:hypothetical protein
MPMRILVRGVVGALCALAGCLALGMSLASAATTHEFLPGVSAKLNQAEPTPVTGPFHTIRSMTVDSGELYIADDFETPAEGDKSRIEKFNASTGAFLFQFPQLASPTFLHQGITVGHSTGEAQVYIGGDEGAGGSTVGVVAVLDPSGSLKKVWTGSDTPSKGFGCFECGASAAIAVDRNPSSLNDWAAGDVYVVDQLNNVVDVFKPLAGGGEEYVTQLTGPEPPGALFSRLSQVVVNPSNGEVLVTDEKNVEGNPTTSVDIFKPAAIVGQYEFTGKLAGPPPSHAFGNIRHMTSDDGNGDIYVTEEATPLVYQFNSEGVFLGELTGTPTGPGGKTRSFTTVDSIAVDPVSHDVYVANHTPDATELDVFGPNVVIPDVTTEAPTGAKATGEGEIEATPNGAVNPQKEGEASCSFVWGTTREFGELAPCEPENVAEGASPVAVHAKLTALAPDTTYYYRLQATNKNGTNPGEAWQDIEFTTPGPGLHGTVPLAVRSESATFSAKVNPHSAPTTFYFQYGTSTAYGADAPALSEDAKHGGAVGSGEGDVEVSQHVTGLTAATLYHYRVAAVSELAPGEFETFYSSDQTFTTQALGLPFQLPDGRRWEMVSPLQKQGALLDSIFSEEMVQASADGNAFTDGSSAPTEAEPAGEGQFPNTFFGRGPGGWQSRVITPPHIGRTELTGSEEYLLFSEDLSKGAVKPEGSFPPLSPEASEATPYLHTNYLNGNPGELCVTVNGCYQPLVTPANVPPGTKFGKEGERPECAGGMCGGPSVIGASPDLKHVLLTSSVDLTSTPTEGQGMYEWSDGKLALVNLLPEGEHNQHGGPVAENVALGNDNTLNSKNDRNAISSEGSRIVWNTTRNSKGHLYVRDTVKGETIRLDVFQAGVEQGPENESPQYEAASNDDSRIFFLDAERLTADSTAKSGRPDLYEYNFNSSLGSRLTDLSVDPSAPAAAHSVLGVSDDGSYVYFSAAGVLAPGAVAGECGIFNIPPPGDTELCNLYVRHNGTTTFIAGLSPEDFPVWSPQLVNLPARVSSNGQWLAFMSSRNLTGYDTTDAITEHLDEEVYLYNAATDRLLCASCNPTGARPVGRELSGDQITGLEGFPRYDGVARNGMSIASNVPTWTTKFYQSRYLSNSGRLFFDSSDAIAPQDVNGTEDVYEYEPAGVGDCGASTTTFSQRSGGCVALISSGESKEESAFLDASESGGDVFFLSEAKLASQDLDNAQDIYDARECSASSRCIAPAPVEPPPCDTGESCKPAPSPQPEIFGAPASSTFSGTGNVVPSISRPVVKQKGLTGAQKLARALKACHKKRGKRRSTCQRQAKKRYAAKAHKVNATKRGRG